MSRIENIWWKAPDDTVFDQSAFGIGQPLNYQGKKAFLTEAVVDKDGKGVSLTFEVTDEDAEQPLVPGT